MKRQRGSRELAAGLMIGEEGVMCLTVHGKRYPAIKVEMCDRKAVEIIRDEWHRPRIYRGMLRCAKTPTNPEGRTYDVRAMGHPADAIMEEFKPLIQGTELLRRWANVKRVCPLPPTARKRILLSVR